MKKYLLTATAAAALLASAVSGSFAATAAIPGGDTCGALPNAKWSWDVVVTPPQIIQGDVSYGGVVYSGNSGNGSAPATQEITTIPGSTICTAMNPAGNAVEDKSTTIGGGEPVTTTVDLGNVPVCFQGPNTADVIDGCR